MRSFMSKIKIIYIGWDFDKYWACREALFDPKTSKFKYLYCKHYVSKINRKQNALL